KQRQSHKSLRGHPMRSKHKRKPLHVLIVKRRLARRRLRSPRSKAMARYRLLSAHYTEEDKLLLGDKELEGTDAPVTGRAVDEKGNDIYDGDGRPILYRGTIVGDGSPHKWTRPPTPEMEGLDPESKRLVEI